MDHLSGSGDALPIGEFFQLGLGQVNNFLEAKMRATIKPIRYNPNKIMPLRSIQSD